VVTITGCVGLPPDLARVGKELLAAGLKPGQRAIIRITRSYPAGENICYRFRAD